MNHNQELANRLVKLAAGLLDGSVRMIGASIDVEEHTVVQTNLYGDKRVHVLGPRTVKLEMEYEEGKRNG